MDLGIKGRRAIVCASSKGLGRACAMALAAEGVHVTLTARGAEALAKTAAEIRKASPGVTVTEVAGDITTPAGREAALKACPDPDILINNAGGPPPGDFRNWTRDDWIKALDANMLTPIELIKATVDGMMARKFGRIVNITSAAVKAPIEVLGLSNGARSRPHRLCRRHRAQDRDQQRHHQRPVAGPVRYRPAARPGCEAGSRQARHHGGSVAGGTRQAQSRRTLRRSRGIRPRPARFSAAPRPASSPDRTSCSTAAHFRARCEGGTAQEENAGCTGMSARSKSPKSSSWRRSAARDSSCRWPATRKSRNCPG